MTAFMIVTGIILIILGLLLPLPLLTTLGIILVVVGVVLMILSSTRGAFGGRRFY